ncbi:TIGR03619 family F420-dependent LLM class oxidoreductase [Actinomadura barringtoniae]|uniref:TIGR03619 family F420-dependent LLM class oxidoreductase n=1 Tax=Actinomadura barringtoniae TaxID=1427535 RepID=A0A939TAT3_9ACTN|nr:TIGR03619 family F420-dependent LLM class oxidoreductase [Actinomadura barringtoniae]MBO2452812.1 TIGR03619 family F420-dependent LLM class oxidoreductase [Actinomadura barringtoniae]
MKVYAHLTQVPIDQVVELARLAEELGFAGISLADHLAAPEQISTPYPYGDAPWKDAPHWGDPWVVAAALGQATRTLRVMTSVYVLPLRHPLAVAKAVATAAVLTGGRVSCGVGAGWLREEFVLAGQEFEGRGGRLDEAIQICRLAWSGEPVEFHGEHYDLDAFTMRPAPAERPPILIGGAGPRALRRAIELGDGWIAPAQSGPELAANITELRTARPEGFEVVAWSDNGRDLGELAQAGADSVRLRPQKLYSDLPDDPAAAMRRFAAEGL